MRSDRAVSRLRETCGQGPFTSPRRLRQIAVLRLPPERSQDRADRASGR